MGQKIITFGLVALLLVGCGGRLGIKTEVQKVYVPTPYCPAPVIPERPTLPFSSVPELAFPRIPNETDQQYYGRLAQAYNGAIVALQGYATELENSLREYAEISKQSKTLEQLIEEEAKKRNSQ